MHFVVLFEHIFDVVVRSLKRAVVQNRYAMEYFNLVIINVRLFKIKCLWFYSLHIFLNSVISIQLLADIDWPKNIQLVQAVPPPPKKKFIQAHQWERGCFDHKVVTFSKLVIFGTRIIRLEGLGSKSNSSFWNESKL